MTKVHLGVDIKGFKNGKAFFNDPFIIITPAELKPHKGHIYAIEAAKKLIDLKITNFKWIFYGSGPLLDDLQKKVNKLDLKNNCFFPGNIDHHKLLNKYQKNEVDILVSSSIRIKDVFEGIPVSLMEAMSYEIPVIATDCGATNELVNGKSGILVNQKDSQALVNAIVDIIDKPIYRRKISLQGRIKIKRDFDTIKNAQDLIKLF